MLILNGRRHWGTYYNKDTKRAVFMAFITEGIILLLIAGAVPLYRVANIFLIIVNILTSVFILSFYLLVSEKLTFYLWKFGTEYPDMKRRIIQERISKKKM